MRRRLTWTYFDLRCRHLNTVSVEKLSILNDFEQSHNGRLPFYVLTVMFKRETAVVEQLIKNSCKAGTRTNVVAYTVVVGQTRRLGLFFFLFLCDETDR